MEVWFQRKKAQPRVRVSAPGGLIAWYFAPTRVASGSVDDIVPFELSPGVTLEYDGDLGFADQPAHPDRGLVGHVDPLDALLHGSGHYVQRVVLHGRLMLASHKALASKRTTLWISDASHVLHEFALWCAERAFEAMRTHLAGPNIVAMQIFELKRAWLDGRATADDLRAASKEASRSDTTDTPAHLLPVKIAALDLVRGLASTSAHEAARTVATYAEAIVRWANGSEYDENGFSREWRAQSAELTRRLLALAPAGWEETCDRYPWGMWGLEPTARTVIESAPEPRRVIQSAVNEPRIARRDSAGDKLSASVAREADCTRR